MEGGGVEKNLILIANYFVKKKIKLSLITYQNKFRKELDKKINIVTPRNKKKNKTKYFKYFICLYLMCKILLKTDCLVFAFQANIYAIIICKLLNKKIIVRSNSSPSGWNKNYFKNLIFKFFLCKSDEIIVNSKNFKKELDKKFKTNSKLIFNPLNKIEILRNSKKKIKFNFFKSHHLNIINIARFTEQKDHLTLLRAIKKVNSKIKTKLLLIGYGPKKNKIINFIKDNNLKNNVCVLKFTKNPFPYLKLADIFVLSSKYEGLPNVLLEALVLKKYIISSNCPTGPKEILDNGNYGSLFKISDHNELSQKIIDYSKNKKSKRKKIIDGFKSLKKYDFKNNCFEYYLIVKKYL
tara:strand:- start:221 stop:1276 length:1056 start_codon:yes stop_codon:yes gene_type:complete